MPVQATTLSSSSKKSSELTLIDRLSRLSYHDAVRLLGSEGKRLLQARPGWHINVHGDVYLGPDLFRVTLRDVAERGGRDPIVTITLKAEATKRLHLNCTACGVICEHMGAALSFILDEKTALGLAVPPAERPPAESLDESELVRRAFNERLDRARSEKMVVKSAQHHIPWTDYTVTSTLSGKSYRVAVRGVEPGDSYCSCPDFRTNTLGTCKHILHVLLKLKRRFSAAKLAQRYRRKNIGVHLHYGPRVALRLLLPDKLEPEVDEVLGKLRGQDIDDVSDLIKRIAWLERTGRAVNVYPDAEEYIQQRLQLDRLRDCAASIRRDPASHPLRSQLLTVELLPYQLDGIAFAVETGRAILADEMGLGKTIQGIGAAELFAREAGISKVLIVCPASLKSQWRAEISRFCRRDCQLILGPVAARAEQYANECFFTICNYEQVLRDILSIERVPWDLIILDEGQRIKNWEAKTSRVIKGLRSKFALVLSGTPLENRLDELYSVVQFIDDRRLGPAFRFYNRHRVLDEKGKVLGYKNLAQLRENLKPILLRRTRDSVQQQLPPRTNEIIRITPTAEQLDLHGSHMRIVSQITRKKFISEMDLLRLQKALLMCRMAADSTTLVDKVRPGYSSKLEELDDLLDRLFTEENRKVIVFSEWTSMLDLIEPLLEKRSLRFVRLDGSVPQRQRQQLVREFQEDPGCKLFLATNAGATGLNLQAANTVINVDLPWNPAVLEQRVARAYRMGQRQPVQVYILVTEQTIEENLLATLSAKHHLSLAALDVESDVDAVDLQSGMDELRRRLEVLLGARPEAPAVGSERPALPGTVGGTEPGGPERISDAEPPSQPSPNTATGYDTHTDGDRAARREKFAATGGQLLTAAFEFIRQIVPENEQPNEPNSPTSRLAASLKQSLSDMIDHDEHGRPRLSIALPDTSLIDNLSHMLARLIQ